MKYVSFIIYLFYTVFAMFFYENILPFVEINNPVMPGDSLYVNTKGIAENTYDAIVIGSGISGGWAVKELCEHGIKTLLLERGRNVTHLKDYPTAVKNPWDFAHRGKLPRSSKSTRCPA